jgi:hypothetical protein
VTDSARLDAIAANGWSLLQTPSGWLVLSVTGRIVGNGATYRAAVDVAAAVLSATEAKWERREQIAVAAGG